MRRAESAGLGRLGVAGVGGVGGTRLWVWACRGAVGLAGAAGLLGLLYYTGALQPSWSWLAGVQGWPRAVVSCGIVALLIVVSFPVALGYLALLLAAGYLLGLPLAALTVLTGANLGVACAHFLLRLLRPHLPLRRLMKRDEAAALFRVISGPQAYKIVFFARLTPIPFGLQNTVFALSEVGGYRYHLASAAGLLPAQLINVYIGSTLRSIHDVIQHSHVTGYIVFSFQILIGVSLMVWIVYRARRELTRALLDTEAGCEGILSTSSSSSSLC